MERQLVYIVGTAKSKRRRRALNTAALNTAQHTGPQHSEDRHRTQLNTAALNSEDRHRTQRLSAQLNTAALNSEDRHRPLHTPQRSEDRHRTQRLSAQLNTAALNSEDRHRPLHTPQRSEDRHRPLHTQAAALKLDLNDINMCLSMSPITGLLCDIHMCIHVNTARGKQHGDPRQIPALPLKSAHGDAPNESRAHTGSSRVLWAVVTRPVGQVGWCCSHHCRANGCVPVSVCVVPPRVSGAFKGGWVCTLSALLCAAVSCCALLCGALCYSRHCLRAAVITVFIPTRTSSAPKRLSRYTYTELESEMMMIAFITIKSSLVPLIEGL